VRFDAERLSVPKLGWRCDTAQRLDSRKEEVGSPAHPDKRCRTADVEIHRSALYRDALVFREMADGIRSGIETVESGVVEPRMLDHLELRRDVGVKGNEQHASLRLFAIGFCRVGLPPLTIWPAAPDDTMHL
jgi:hypothetical protein